MPQYNSTPPTLASGGRTALQTDANGNLKVASGFLPAGTDRSGSITTGATAQDVAAANTARTYMDFQNTSDTVMRVTENGVTATSTTGYQVAAGASMTIVTSNRISVYCATTGKTFASTEL